MLWDFKGSSQLTHQKQLNVQTKGKDNVHTKLLY